MPQNLCRPQIHVAGSGTGPSGTARPQCGRPRARARRYASRPLRDGPRNPCHRLPLVELLLNILRAGDGVLGGPTSCNCNLSLAQRGRLRRGIRPLGPGAHSAWPEPRYSGESCWIRAKKTVWSPRLAKRRGRNRSRAPLGRDVFRTQALAPTLWLHQIMPCPRGPRHRQPRNHVFDIDFSAQSAGRTRVPSVRQLPITYTRPEAGLPLRRVGNPPVVSLHPFRVEPPIRYAAPEQTRSRPLSSPDK